MFSVLLQNWNFLGPVLVLTNLIFFHEAGHFLVAKWMGLPVRVFSLGYGPRLCGFKWNETDVRLSLFPFGGYIQLLESNTTTGILDAEIQNTTSTSSWKYLLLYSGGIIANIIVSVVILFGFSVNQARFVSSPLIITDVAPKSAAYDIGLKPRDIIHSLDNLNFPGNTSNDLATYIQSKPGRLISIAIERDGSIKKINALVRNESGRGKLGIAFETNRRNFKISDIITGIQRSLQTSARLSLDVLSNIGKLIFGKADVKEVGGPIAIIHISSVAAQNGIMQLLYLTALLSINFAVINVLPIPFLDGGHITIFLIEKLLGRTIDSKLKSRFFMGGLAFLVVTIVLVTVLDIMRLFR